MIELVLSCSILISSFAARESCDLIELNHFHDCNARPIFDQIIFYEWNPVLDEYHVRAWMMFDETVCLTRNYITNKHIVRWNPHGQNREHTVVASSFRESWTQVDPERANKKLLPEMERARLIHNLKR